MQFTDKAVIAGTRRRDDGSLIADARIARTGVQAYLGSEVDRPDMGFVFVYRPGIEVFSEDTLKSAAHRPVTNDHPADLVTSKNWKKHSVGQTGDEVTGEGIFIRVPLMVSDEGAIKDIEGGKRELSAGYTCDLDFTPGVTPTGESYDAVQRNIRLNHVAIVRQGRAGSEVRIGDSAAYWGAAPINSEGEFTMADNIPALKSVTVDGISIQTTDQGAQAIEKLNKQLDDAAKAKAVVDTKLAEEVTKVATKDAEIATLKKQLDDAKVTPQQMRDAARAYAKTAKQAKALSPETAIGDDMDELAIRKAVVTAKLGDKAKSWNDAQIATSFDTLAAGLKDEDMDTDTTRDIVRDGIPSKDITDGEKAASDAYAQMVEDMKSGHLAKAAA